MNHFDEEMTDPYAGIIRIRCGKNFLGIISATKAPHWQVQI